MEDTATAATMVDHLTAVVPDLRKALEYLNVERDRLCGELKARLAELGRPEWAAYTWEIPIREDDAELNRLDWAISQVDDEIEDIDAAIGRIEEEQRRRVAMEEVSNVTPIQAARDRALMGQTQTAVDALNGLARAAMLRNDGNLHGAACEALGAIGVALGTLSDKADELMAKVLTSEQLDAMPPPTSLIGDALYLDTLAVVYGFPGSCKSFVVADMALSVATGTWWQGREVTKRNVLYVMAEGAPGFGARKRAWCDHHGVTATEGIRWLPLAVNLMEADWAAAVAEVARRLGIGLVVIDTLSRSMPGGDENAARDMTRVIDNCDAVRQATGACVLLVHHAPRTGGNPRGHSSLEGAVATTIEVTRDGSRVKLHNTKQKDAEEFADIRLEFVPTASSGVLVSRTVAERSAEVDEKCSELFGFLADVTAAEPISASTLDKMVDEALGLKRSAFRSRLNVLLTKGVVRRLGTEARPTYQAVIGGKLVG